MRVMIVTGTRPQIIKSAPIIQKLMDEKEIELDFIHTGQHYDENLFENFIEEFGLMEPYNLYVNGDAIELITGIMISLESYIVKKGTPDLILVPGDTNSALAAGLTAVKMDIPFGHIEAGVREWELNMHEEMNRRILDHSASVLFAPTQFGQAHLMNEKVQGQIHLVGDTNYDLYLARENKKSVKTILKDFNIWNWNDYVILTTHRRENVQDQQRLINILSSVNDMNKTVIFPIHPNTWNLVKKLDMKFPNIRFIKPVGYDDMMALVSECSLLITDSGGLQKEAYFANAPCVTLREVTAWTETTIHGGNRLCGSDDIDRMRAAYDEMFNKKLNNPKMHGDGNASGKIVDIILKGGITIPNKTRNRNG